MFYTHCQLQFGYASNYNPLTKKLEKTQKKIYEMLLKYLRIPECVKSVVNVGNTT